MFSKDAILTSLDSNGCRKIGRNKWSDGTYNFRIVGDHNGYEVIAERIVSAVNASEAVRAALRPMFLEARAAGGI
jgi:hypothetical protein